MNGLQRGEPLIEFINSNDCVYNYQGMPDTDYIEHEDGSITWNVSDCETIQRMSELYRLLVKEQ